MSFDRTQAEIIQASSDSPDPVAEAEAVKLARFSIGELAAEAKTYQEKVAAANGRIIEVRAETLNNACAAGHRYLAIKRKLPHGQFGNWIKDSGLQRSQKTVERYMWLAQKSSHVSKMLPGTSLRKAYIALGIITPSKSVSLAKDVQAQVAKVRNLMSKISGKIEGTEYAALMKEVDSLQSQCAEFLKKNAGVRTKRLKSGHGLNSPYFSQELLLCLAPPVAGVPLCFTLL